ncbi:MAG: hypothetical protein K0S53_1922 [Bacteroidetes bacterium]|jgi:hypothetical protein|nr:hypothetical protein [Bacteroidota bacterium]
MKNKEQIREHIKQILNSIVDEEYEAFAKEIKNNQIQENHTESKDYLGCKSDDGNLT